MSDLYPTKTRLALLQAIDDGSVFRHFPILPEEPYDGLDRGPGQRPRYVKVTARIAGFERVGWVRLLPRESGAHYKEPRRWELTDAGREVLEANW